MTLLVIVLEASHARQYIVQWVRGVINMTPLPQASWDTPPYMTDANGARLIDEAVRRMRAIPQSELRRLDAVAITTPGTIRGTSVIDGSSRLQIRESINVTEKFAQRREPPCHVFHDVEALAFGELRHGTRRPDTPSEFAYVLIDEGIGCALFVDGKPYLGAGVAGHLGRLVVNPDGPYNETFRQRGPLESYAARPWVSYRIVAEYRAEAGKNRAAGDGNGPFRATLQELSERSEHEWQALTVGQIAEGLRNDDPIVGPVLDEAARYLSLGINAVMTIMNPKQLILGGSMMESVPELYEKVMTRLRRDAWAGAWNETIIRQPTLRDAQVFGAAEMLADTLSGRPPR